MDYGKIQEAWLEKYGTVDKDIDLDREKAKREKAISNRTKNFPIQDTIDLHGYTREEARRALEIFIGDCKRKGFRKVLIIHGKGLHAKDGESVLAKEVKAFIENDRRCGASSYGDVKEGGSGATWVMLK